MTALPHRDLHAYSIDLIIGRLPRVIPEDVEAETLYHETPFVVGGADHPLARRRRVAVAPRR